MKNFWKKRITLAAIFLSLILLGAFGVRFWNFAPWLYFEADQARDANIVKKALEEGPGYLPLLGPRAAGTFLRLGPAEYYFQYLSARIFNSAEPFVLAYPALVFSLLSIGVFYFFLKKFFSRKISLLVTAVYAFSFILIQYARFAWNPNGIPFWGLLFIFSIYQATALENRKKAGGWLILAGISYGVVSQLHFLALVGFPVVAGLFWLFYFPKKIKIYFWLAALSGVLILYLPMFLSEMSTDGDNFKQFRYALTAKTGSGEISLPEKIKSDSRQTAIAFSMFLTSFGHKDSRIAFYFGTGLIFFGLALAGWAGIKDKKKRLLGWLLFSWLIVFLFLYFKTATSLKPRFFFPLTAVPFFLWAYFLDFFVLFNKRKKVGYFLAFCLSGILIWANLDAVKQWYNFLEKADDKAISRPMSLKQDSGITLAGLTASADFMAKESQKKAKNVCYDGIQEYKRTMEYILEIRYPELGRARISNGMKPAEKEACEFFSFAQKKTGRPKISSRHSQYFEAAPVFEAGNLAVWSLSVKREFYTGEELPVIKEEKEVVVEPEQKINEDIEEKDPAEIEEVTAEETTEVTETEKAPAAAEPPPRPRRVERVYWKDVF